VRVAHLLTGLFELVLHVDVTRRDKGVDAGERRRLDGTCTSLDVSLCRARKTTDDGGVLSVTDRFSNLLNGGEVVGRCDGEASLDDVDPEAGELLSNLRFGIWGLGLYHVDPEAGELLSNMPSMFVYRVCVHIYYGNDNVDWRIFSFSSKVHVCCPCLNPLPSALYPLPT
jgi:hypothetical protein